MRILLTGFEPFQGENLNPSRELARVFKKAAVCDVLLLPVSYQRSFDLLISQVEKGNYDFVLMLGQAGGRSKIGLEKVAVNLIASDFADEDGASSQSRKILEGGPEAYVSELPLGSWLSIFEAGNLPVEISHSAGTFVCNCLYYRMLHHARTRELSTRALFVHVPYLTGQVLGKAADTPSLSLEVMEQTIAQLMQMIRDQ